MLSRCGVVVRKGHNLGRRGGHPSHHRCENTRGIHHDRGGRSTACNNIGSGSIVDATHDEDLVGRVTLAGQCLEAAGEEVRPAKAWHDHRQSVALSH